MNFYIGLWLIVLSMSIQNVAKCKFGPFGTEQPNPKYRPSMKHPKPISTFWGANNRPYPTNAWWENLILNKGEETLNAFPYIYKAKADRMCFTLPTLVENKEYIFSLYTDEWCVMLPDSTDHKILRYDELSVTLRYQLKDSIATYPIVQGSPFVVTQYERVKPEIRTIATITQVIDEDGKIYKPEDNPILAPSSKVIVFMNNTRKWVLYFDKKIPIKVTSQSLSGVITYSGAMKLAVLDKQETSEIFDQYRNTFAIGVDLDYSVADVSAKIIYNWVVSGKGKLLMMALPHHVDAFERSKKVDGINYRTIRGVMTAIEGETWEFTEYLQQYIWDAPRPIDPDKLPAIKRALEEDYKYVPSDKDPYFFGIEIGRLAKLTLIADEIGDTEKANYMRSNLMKQMAAWIEGTNPDHLVYDSTYGGIVSSDGIANEQSDYGNGYYNDHHYHYGYHIFAIAVIGRKNPEFVENYKEPILTYVRDFANPSKEDKFFTITRMKDWFGWHSYASGLFEFTDGRNQESTSEAIMAYYSLVLLGNVMKHTELEKFGKLLLAMEIRATKKYWHMPENSNIYPDPFKKNRMVGIVWSNKVDYATWFGKYPLFIHCIQMLPFLPPTESSLDKEFMKEEYEIIKNENTPSDWIPFRVSARAIIDKEAAWLEAIQLKVFHVGTCRTIVYHWIATRK